MFAPVHARTRAATSRSQGSHFISSATKALPTRRMVMLTRIPIERTRRLPWDSAPTASTLSRLMVTSATRIVNNAGRMLCEVPGVTPGVPEARDVVCSSNAADCLVLRSASSRMAMMSKISPPIACNQGNTSKKDAMKAKTIRRTVAPAPPKTIALHRGRRGSPAAAAPMTRALSPLNTKSTNKMPAMALNSSSMTVFLMYLFQVAVHCDPHQWFGDYLRYKRISVHDTKSWMRRATHISAQSWWISTAHCLTKNLTLGYSRNSHSVSLFLHVHQDHNFTYVPWPKRHKADTMRSTSCD